MNPAPKGLPSQINTVNAGKLAFGLEGPQADRRTTVGILPPTGLSFIVCADCSLRLAEIKTRRTTSDYSKRKRWPDFYLGGIIWCKRRDVFLPSCQETAESWPFRGRMLLIPRVSGRVGGGCGDDLVSTKPRQYSQASRECHSCQTRSANSVGLSTVFQVSLRRVNPFLSVQTARPSCSGVD